MLAAAAGVLLALVVAQAGVSARVPPTTEPTTPRNQPPLRKGETEPEIPTTIPTVTLPTLPEPTTEPTTGSTSTGPAPTTSVPTTPSLPPAGTSGTSTTSPPPTTTITPRPPVGTSGTSTASPSPTTTPAPAGAGGTAFSSTQSATAGAIAGQADLVLRPAPVVRIRGRAFRSSSVVDVLRVTAGRGVLVEAQCRPTCRLAPQRRVLLRAGSVRLRRFERRFAAGRTIVVRVTAPGRIGKYTSFRVRSRRAPLRVDRCLSLSGRPRSCPAA